MIVKIGRAVQVGVLLRNKLLKENGKNLPSFNPLAKRTLQHQVRQNIASLLQ
jgi:hypothetical protein